MSDGPIDREPDDPSGPPASESTAIHSSLADTADEVFRLKAAGAFDRPIFKGSIVDALLNAGIVDPGGALRGGKLDFGELAIGAEKSQARIAAIKEAMREPFVLPTIPRLPSPELVAMQQIEKAIAVQGDLLEEQVSQAVRLAQLQEESGRVQAAANGVMTGLTAALVVFTSVLVFEPAHGEPVGLVIGLALSAIILRATIRTHAAGPWRRLRRGS
jgi:hypothetical protein